MKLAAAAVAVLLVTSVSLYPLCNALFRCGCGAMWGAAGTHCNVHASPGAHCPWCDHPRLGTLGFVSTLGLQAAVFAVARRKRLSVAGATLASVLALPLAVLASGGASWLATDYPHFVVKDLRERVGVPAGPFRTVH